MKYHFRVHDEDGLWAECIELAGCSTQGEDRAELERNMREALNLYLEEPASSSVVFPPPQPELSGPGVVPVEVEPGVAFSVEVRRSRLRRKLTQAEAARRMGMASLYSCQRLERRSNPSLATMRKVKRLFPELSLDRVLGD